MREYIVRSSDRLEHEVRDVGIQWTNKLVQYIEQILLSSRNNMRREDSRNNVAEGTNLELVNKKIEEVDKVHQLAALKMRE